jgi:phosphorylase kinase alpha/beta subunit
MTASGLCIVFTVDEVVFVQNLVFYIERAYRIPDYGIWERGNKSNLGARELNASSVGMAKAALEAMAGLDLFGARGSSKSSVVVIDDTVALNAVLLQSVIPRESASKETDGALLSILTYPAFALPDDQAAKAKAKLLSSLEGRYGCKRFLRDGHQTVLEDPTRLHYEAYELKNFAGVECEWPLFFCYLAIDGFFREDLQEARKYLSKLKELCVERDGMFLLPELYVVPRESIEAERANPHSQTRRPNDNVPLVWAQSLYYLAQMMDLDLLSPGDLDPIGRRFTTHPRFPPVVQIAFISESLELRQQLLEYGVESQTEETAEPIILEDPSVLSRAFSNLGTSPKMGLTGRPFRPVGSTTTSSFYTHLGKTILFAPPFLSRQQFYLSLDPEFFVDDIRSHLAFLQQHWRRPGRPTVAIVLKQDLFKEPEQAIVLDFINELRSGECAGVRVKIGRVQELRLTGATSNLGFLPRDFSLDQPIVSKQKQVPILTALDLKQTSPCDADFVSKLESWELPAIADRVWASPNSHEVAYLLGEIVSRSGLQCEVASNGRSATAFALLQDLYSAAAQHRQWSIIRYTSGLMRKLVGNLTTSVSELLIRGLDISFSPTLVIASAVSPDAMLDLLVKASQTDGKGENPQMFAFLQELVFYAGILVKKYPEQFAGILRLRLTDIIQALVQQISFGTRLPLEVAQEQLWDMSPYSVLHLVTNAISGGDTDFHFTEMSDKLRKSSSLNLMDKGYAPVAASGPIYRRRVIQGIVARVPEQFYADVFSILERSPALLLLDRELPAQPTLNENTPGERNFAFKVQYLLDACPNSAYRSLAVEALQQLGNTQTS